MTAECRATRVLPGHLRLSVISIAVNVWPIQSSASVNQFITTSTDNGSVQSLSFFRRPARARRQMIRSGTKGENVSPICCRYGAGTRVLTVTPAPEWFPCESAVPTGSHQVISHAHMMLNRIGEGRTAVSLCAGLPSWTRS